ncbi:GPI ethanolamine phosphate transferase 1 [Schistosoma japonicum]|uniref:GPI ethanolamine phosphate transferase 1 n=2 Tax=Schistosoma japonicum TaxID=6182 RepID=A0A4Z2DSN2_SCHJA|nr:GPI ethanolamine phosphate transferase 1 [Schistosoma japonicum]
MEYTPFLRDILLHRGVWGVSHTRVPTESRPAHVAILGGFYEDVASITNGWRTNPVEFDTVLNRSTLAWIWGYKEVVMSFVPPFAHHIKATPCPDELSDLAKANPTEIDRWVTDQFTDFIDNSDDFFDDLTAISNDYRQGRMVFLHLDAADMVGHSFKPDSPEYVKVLRNLDKVIFRVYQKLTEKSRGSDSRIAYILTSDHGMTEWGSHGSGSLHETVTPLLAWGSGIVGPVEIETNMNNLSTDKKDVLGLPLHNYGRLRREIQQADLCPLMSGLLGIPIPVNSIGQVPVEFLKIPEYDKVKLVRANWLQIYAQLKIKYTEKKKSHFGIFFREFPSLKMSDIYEMENMCELLISSGKYHEAIQEYRHLTSSALKGLNYYHKYDRLYLGFCVSLTFCLWSLVILCRLFIRTDNINHKNYQSYADSFYWTVINFTVIGFSLLVLSFANSWSLGPTIYQLVPLILVLSLSYPKARRKQLLTLVGYVWKGLFSDSSTTSSFFTVCSITFMSICILELLVWGFFHRYLLSLGCLLLSSWPYIDKSFRPHEKHTQIVLSFWCVSCCCLAIFPLLPVIGSNMYPTIVFMSGLILTPIGIITLRFVSNSQNHLYMLLGYFFGFVICLSSFAVYAMSFPMVRTGSLKTIIHIYSWSVIILLPLSVILIIPTQLGPRVVGWTVVYLVPLILMSTFYEVTFFAVFAVVTYLWLYIEVKKQTSLLKHDNIRLWDIETSTDNTYSNIQNQFAFCENLLTLRNFRQSLFFIFFLTISFFGTGNIASINSFDPRSTFCFTTILNPALMAILLLIKVICPMLFLGVIYAVIQLCNDSLFDYSSFVKYINNRKSKRGHDSILAHTGLTAVLSNLIAIHFFLWLRDEGSWLDIGTSISHYVIAMSISLAAFLFALLGKKMLSIQMGTKIHQALLKVSNKYV